jgi:hypothetical protein
MGSHAAHGNQMQRLRMTPEKVCYTRHSVFEVSRLYKEWVVTLQKTYNQVDRSFYAVIIRGLYASPYH